LIRNSKWTFDAEQFQQRFNAFKLLLSLLQFSKSSLIYIEVWKRRCELPAHQKTIFWSFDQSPMIFCLIWLLSYEGSISNSFQVWRNIVAGVAVILVLWQRHKLSCGGCGCTLRTIVLCQRSLQHFGSTTTPNFLNVK